MDRPEDRWEWRRRIRADPRRLRMYRVAVAVAGALLIILGGLTGPVPGPGGIPLVLLGIAVWASEFEWAHRLMQWLRGWLQRLRGWSRGQRMIAWSVVAVLLVLCAYGCLLLVGIPDWLAAGPTRWLARLPGV